MNSVKNMKKAKAFFIFSSLILVAYFFMALPYKQPNNPKAVSGNWCASNILEEDPIFSNGSYYYENGCLIEKNNILYIFNEYQLGYYAYCMNNNIKNFKDKNVKLMNNLNMATHYWTPIKSFKQTFDGNGYTISNLNILNDGNCNNGFISYTNYNGNIIKNLTLSNPKINSKLTVYNGVLVGYADGSTITNCTIKSNTRASTYDNIIIENSGATYNNFVFVGGLVGSAYASVISNSYFKGFIGVTEGTFNAPIQVGGIVGQTQNSTVSACLSEGNIFVWVGKNIRLGGIVGYAEVLNIGINGVIEKSFNKTKLSAGQNKTQAEQVCVGGISGKVVSSSQIIKNCFNQGELNANAKEQNYEDISNQIGMNLNIGDIGEKATWFNSGKSSVYDSIAKVYKKGTSNYIGGIVGHCVGKVEKCYNVGKIATESYETIQIEYSDMILWTNTFDKKYPTTGTIQFTDKNGKVIATIDNPAYCDMSTYTITYNLNCYSQDICGNIDDVNKIKNCYALKNQLNLSVNKFNLKCEINSYVSGTAFANMKSFLIEEYESSLSGISGFEVNKSNHFYYIKLQSFEQDNHLAIFYVIPNIDNENKPGSYRQFVRINRPVPIIQTQCLQLGQNILPSGFSSDVWAINNKLNGDTNSLGHYIEYSYPIIKDFYWIYNSKLPSQTNN